MSGACNQNSDANQQTHKADGRDTEYTLTNRDVMLYNLGIGAKRTDLRYVL